MPLLGSGKELTAKHRRFIQEYLVDMNAARAALRAGYSPGTARKSGYQLLKRTAVAEAIAAAQSALAVKLGITVEKVVVELARIGFSDIRDVVQWRSFARETGPGNEERSARVTSLIELKDANDMTLDVAAAIAEVSQQPSGGIKVKLHDKRAALVDLGRHLGMFAERRERASITTVEIVRFSEEQGDAEQHKGFATINSAASGDDDSNPGSNDIFNCGQGGLSPQAKETGNHGNG